MHLTSLALKERSSLLVSPLLLSLLLCFIMIILFPSNYFLSAIDWFKAPNLSQEMENRYIKPIEAGMLLPQLNTQDEYVRLMERVGFSIVSRKDISENCSKTWYKIDSKLCSFNKKTLGGIYAWKIFLIPPFGKLHFQKDGRCYLLYEPSRTCGPGTPPETFAMAIL
jgi:hypothetical protein